MTRGQLILTDETLRVLCTMLPYSAVADQLARARNGWDGGHLTTSDVRMLDRLLGHAVHDLARVVTGRALRQATTQFREQVLGADLARCEREARHSISVFVWDEERDGPRTPAVLADAMPEPVDEHVPVPEDLRLGALAAASG